MFVLSNLQLKGRKQIFTVKRPFDLFINSKSPSEWLTIVDNVRTILQRQNEYIYIPDLRPAA